MSERDDALEEAALAIEAPDFAEWRGCLSKTKKGQREFAIRLEAIRETKRSMASYIRSFKGHAGNDLRHRLEEVAERANQGHEHYDIPAIWKMADLGWVGISITICATERTIPARASHHVTLTKRGEKVLAEFLAERDAAPIPMRVKGDA